jgi:hypothetical protein
MTYRDSPRPAATWRARARQVTSGTRSIALHIEPAGIAISFGFGKKHGFTIVEILLVSHGADKNDTVVTAEKKVPNFTKSDART